MKKASSKSVHMESSIQYDDAGNGKQVALLCLFNMGVRGHLINIERSRKRSFDESGHFA
ncbi:hypothetical protein G8759_01200 [Spirosoma aureum]|uniref:Uncharacterized protein n=1 Tax=Spirosoma aureum TaxID=2692134 RepID=A0A6G9AFV1_9BACT|nr:hypothetical protein [Spirosoma aureum]QIP11352.1 hypothetical protein G8759_01200 [Spirosoma aureum]